MLVKDNFIFVEYNGVSFPPEYTSHICEVAGHLDKKYIEAQGPYSLHTEYSYGKRKYNTNRIKDFPILIEAQKDGVPQLWKSESWAETFAEFIIGMTAEYNPPTIIEIQPPFNDYCSLDEFAERYNIFEKKIHSVYPDTLIVVKNRSGTVYPGGRFLIGKATEIVDFCNIIKTQKINLGIVLDFPQLLTAESINSIKFDVKKYQAAIDIILQRQDFIKGIHLWGKKKSTTGRWVAHAGNLDTYFDNNTKIKEIFISGIQRICSDGARRFLVLEVNSGADDLGRILSDLFD